jgi:NADH-quinone oxidoreductase subunit L
MEGPTPVSALIHAATMVTAGVYLVARMYPLFLADTSGRPDGRGLGRRRSPPSRRDDRDGAVRHQADHGVLDGLAARVHVRGLGVLTTTGGVFHVLTHAFFKATLFLCVRRRDARLRGQLDLRKLSGRVEGPRAGDRRSRCSSAA